jgi:hypothetical protein
MTRQTMGGIIEIISRNGDELSAQDARVRLTVQGPHPSKEARTLNNRTF